MDVVCDTLMVFEILPRLPPESLMRLGAASRRYNALVHDPGFAARYWPRAGVLVQPLEQPKEAVPVFLTGNNNEADDELTTMPGADLAFLPGLSAAEKESMLRADDDPDGVVVLHSAAGLVLCCRARVRTARYYVCNPVTRQHVALPKLEEEAPARKHECRCGLLTLTADTKSSFRVVIVHWPEDLDQTMCLDLSVFSSDTGQWEVRKLALPPDLCYEDIFGSPPILGQSGTSYWIWHTWADYAIAYNSSSANNPILEIALPPRLPGWEDNRCIGERRHGWGLQFAQSNSSSVLEVWKSDLIGGRWSLSLRVTIADLVALNPEVAGSFMCDRYGNTRINPVGFHPTDEDVVFIAMPGAVFAYSMERGTLTLLRRTKDCLIPADVYPYTHPDYPVQVPAIKDDAAVMIMELPRQQCGCSTETPVNGTIEQRKRLRDQACS